MSIDIRRDTEMIDMYFMNRFQPDCLPDARHGSIPDSIRVFGLFTYGLIAVVGRIPNTDGQQIFLLQRRRNIKRERGITSGMIAYLYIIDPYFGFPIDRPEMQEYLFSFPV